MNWKEFLKPTIIKMIFTILLLFLSFLYIWGAADAEIRGFPIGYIEKSFKPDREPSLYLNYTGLIVDIIFWYLISCSIIFIYSKSRGKKK